MPPQQVKANKKVGVQIHIVFATINIAVYNSLSHVHYKSMLFNYFFNYTNFTASIYYSIILKYKKCIFSPIKIIKKLAPIQNILIGFYCTSYDSFFFSFINILSSQQFQTEKAD